MLCPRCGTSVGDAIKMCDRCAAEAPPKPPVSAAPDLSNKRHHVSKLAHELPVDTSFIYQLLSPIGLSIISLIVWLIASIVLAITFESGAVGLSLIFGAIFLCVAIGMISWGWMWIQMFAEEPMISFFAILFPVLVYRVVMTYPERTLKPFFLHIGSGIAGFLLVLLTGSIYGDTATEKAFAVFVGGEEAGSTAGSDYDGEDYGEGD